MFFFICQHIDRGFEMKEAAYCMKTVSECVFMCAGRIVCVRV